MVEKIWAYNLVPYNLKLLPGRRWPARRQFLYAKKHLTKVDFVNSIRCKLFIKSTFKEVIMQNMNEKVLNAWLRLSTTICNERIVSEMPYNESLICGILHHNALAHPEKKITATELCEKTNIQKSCSLWSHRSWRFRSCLGKDRYGRNS